jgi:hypothetical protein
MDVTFLRPRWAQESIVLNRIGERPCIIPVTASHVFTWKATEVIAYNDGTIRHRNQLYKQGLVSRNYEPVIHCLDNPKIHIDTPVGLINHSNTSNFGHAVFEGLSRLAVLELSGVDRPIAINKGSRVVDFLRIINKDFIEVEFPASFKDVVIPSCPLGRDTESDPFVWKDAVFWVRHKFTNFSAYKGRKLYCVRANAKHRNVLNDAEVISELKKLGFDIVDLALLTVKEQLQLAGESRVMVMPGGAGSGIAMFTSGAFIELLPPAGSGMFGSLIPCALTGVPYKRLVGTVDGVANQHSNFTVPMDELLEAVRKVL